MPTNNIRIILDGCLAKFKEQNQLALSDSEIFELFCGSQLTKTLNISFEEIQDSIVDGSNDGGIDLFLCLVNDDYIGSIDEIEDLKFSSSTILKTFINQSKKEGSFKESSIDKLLATMPLIFDLSKDDNILLDRLNPSLLDKVLLFRKLWEKTLVGGGRINIYYNYSCLSDNLNTINGSFNSKIDQLIGLTKANVTGSTVKFGLQSSSELFDLYQKNKPNRIELVFKENPGSISYNNEIGYVGAVLLKDFVKFIKDDEGNLREDLFESNIRHYQGEVDVNNKIQNTLESDLKRDFWWLNNGITIIASEPKQIAKKLSIEGIQIVNGLQTTYTVASFYKETADDDRSVLVKVIINNDKETIDKIIASTNSQNAVSSTLLRATDTTQRNIEAFFATEGYYYDRRKNFYKNQGKPAKRIFSIQFAAQAIQTILYNDPASARAKPTTLIKDDTSYKNIFNPHIDFKAYLRSCQIVQKTFDYYSSISDLSIRVKLSNFKLHLARTLVSVILNKGVYTAQDVIGLDVTLVEEAHFAKSLVILSNIIDDFFDQNTGILITYIAKNQKFNSFLIERIRSLLVN